MIINIIAQQLEVYKVTADSLFPVKIWSIRNGQQDILHDTLLAGETVLLGPFLNITSFRVEGSGTVTVEKVFENFSSPIELLDYIGTNVTNVTPGDTITVTAGNVLDQRIGYKDNTSGCSASPVTLSASGCTIDGESSFSINEDDMYVELVWDGSSNWRVA